MPRPRPDPWQQYLDGLHLARGHCVPHRSPADQKRLRTHYRLFCDALGFGAEVFRLGPRRLDALRRQIDWDSRTGRVRSGSFGKWDRATARREIRRRLESLDG